MLFALLAITAATVSAQQWELIDSPHSPSPRAGHTMTFVGDTLYLFGGFSGAGQALNDLWRWDDTAGDWIEMHPTNPPSPRYGHAAVAAGGRLWVILGQDGTPTGSIWVYDPATNAWHDDTPPGAELVSRIQHAATVIAHPDGSDTIYFTGGLSFFFEALTEAWAIDVTGSKSTDLRRLADLPVGLYGHALAPSKPLTPGALDRIANSYGRTIESVSDRLIYLELANVPSEWIDQPGDPVTFNRVASAPTLDGRTLVVGDRPLDDGPQNEILIQTLSHGEGDVEIDTQNIPTIPVARFESTCAVAVDGIGSRYFTVGGGRTLDGTYFDDYWQGPYGGLPLRFPRLVPAANGAGVGTEWTTRWSGINGSDLNCDFNFSDREIRRTDNVVGDWFGVADATGWVRVQADHAVSATSRTFSTSGGEPGTPTYGQGIPAVPVSDSFGSAARPVATIPGLERSADPTMGLRSNLILINLGETEITLEATLYDGGQLLGTTTYTLRGFGLQIVTDVFRTVTGMDVTRGSAFVRSTTPGGRFFAAGSMVDNQRGDGTWVPGQ
jgi:hypothetical protein